MNDLRLKINSGEQKTIPLFLKEREETKVEARLAEGSNLQLLAFFFGKDSESYSLETDIFHEGPNSKSETIVRGVLMGQSLGKVLGKVNIKKGAKGADAHLSGKILLFDEAKVSDATPTLEIDENEVKASHAMAVGRIDDETLFYLQSRGLELEEAKKLIISGFFQPILDRLNNKGRKRLQVKLKSV